MGQANYVKKLVTTVYVYICTQGLIYFRKWSNCWTGGHFDLGDSLMVGGYLIWNLVLFACD